MATVGEDIGTGGAVVSGTAGVKFIAAGQVDSDVEVVWDFDGDGDFNDSLEDITPYVLQAETTIGRDYPSQFSGKVTPGKLRMTLNNSDDRFNRFGASPYVGAGLSLETGRQIRVRNAGAAETVPTLLVKNRFIGTEGDPIAADELGNAWTNRTGLALAYGADNTAVIADSSAEAINTIDVGQDDYYVQASIPTPTVGGDSFAILYRYSDTTNYGRLLWWLGFLRHDVVVAGVATVHTVVDLEWRPNTVVGCLISGSDVTVYANGVAMFTDTGDAAGTTETAVGLRGKQSQVGNLQVDSFNVWDSLHATTDTDNLFTGTIARLDPRVSTDGRKTAELVAFGRFGQLASYRTDTPPWTNGTFTEGFLESPDEGAEGGILIGQLLGEVGLLLPPSADAITKASSVMGGAGFFDGGAIGIARKIEETERALLWEDESGQMRYDTTLDAGTLQGTWTNASPGQLVFESVDLINYQREVINRVKPAIGPKVPELRTITGNESSTAAGSLNTLGFTVDAGAVNGDLVIVTFMAAVQNDDELWLVPPGWVDLRPWGDGFGMRIFAHVIDDDQSTAYTFFADSGGDGGGVAVLHTYWASGTWHGSIEEGVRAIVDGWGQPNTTTKSRAGTHTLPSILWDETWPSAFQAMRGGAVGNTSGNVDTTSGNEVAPVGYTTRDAKYQAGTSGSSDDAALERAFRQGFAGVESPTPFTGDFENFDYLDVALVAIRGFDGTPPGSGQPATFNDTDSQEATGTIATFPDPAQFLPDSAARTTYAADVLTAHSTDRPLFRVNFTANKNAHYRLQAMNRVRDRVTLNFTVDGRDGFVVINQVYIIESVTHRFDQGNKRWQVEWELGPA